MKFSEVKSIERGQVFSLNDTIQVGKDFGVYITCGGISARIGVIDVEERFWYKSTRAIDMSSEIVYLGDFKFSLKRSTSRLEEFMKLSGPKQEAILFNSVMIEAEPEDDPERYLGEVELG